MKRLYICGSFRFMSEMKRLESSLKDESIEYRTSKKTDRRGIPGCLEKIDWADVVYIVDPEGYIGKSVSVDIGYAYARSKLIYAMHLVDDPPVRNLINGFLSPKELVDFLKEGEIRQHH